MSIRINLKKRLSKDYPMPNFPEGIEKFIRGKK